MEEIRNKVKESGLINLDLADFKPDTNSFIGLDIANQLWKGLILKEKDFREYIKTENWSTYSDKSVFIHCSADAIVPTWAYMLVATALHGIANRVVVGSKLDLEKILIQEKIESFSLLGLENGRFIIKGCSDISAPEFAMVCLTQKLQPFAKSIMYGEPCSTVPIYKAK